MDLVNISNRCNLSKETKFKKTTLSYNYNGKENYAQLISDVYGEIKNGILPGSFGTYKNLRYRFTFTTTNNCIIKGEFFAIKTKFISSS